ncbi:MAG: dTMP kinase [Clostridia bacterium]|nr:dTMP kinase [Clostridia bacterium]
MSTFPYDAIVFDLDGTLFDAEEGIISSVKYAMQKLGYPIPESADLREVVGPPLRDSFCGMLGVPEKRAEEAVTYYHEHFGSKGMYLYSLYPNIRSVLQMLSEDGVHVALATSKPRWRAVQILEYFGIMKYFDDVVGEGDDACKLGKPELIRRALPDKHRTAAMVGDRKYDVEGAKANGIEAIGVSYGCGTEEELADAGADVIVPDTESLRALLCPGGVIPRGFFLSVEGPDGSGKTTQVNLLEKSLRQFGFNVLRTREPGGCAISEDIRRIVLDASNMEMCDTCEALLYAASRAQHVHQVIRPAVERGELVLCDRFVDSSVAYQGGGRELGVETIQQINEPAVAGMLPDATLYLAIDHAVALKRRYAASEPDRLELAADGFHARVQKAYERLVRENKKRFLVVDASQDIESIAKDALDAVLKRLIPDRKVEVE